MDDETTRNNSEIESIWYKDREKIAVYNIKKYSKESPKKPITNSSFDTCGNMENIRAPETQAVSTTPRNLIKQSVGKKNLKYRNSCNIKTYVISKRMKYETIKEKVRFLIQQASF